MLLRLQTIFDDLLLQPVTLTPALSADEVEEWDSLLQVSIVAAAEERFGIQFRTGEVEATRNVGDLVALIQRHLSRQAG